MAITYATLEARVGVSFTTSVTTEPSQAIVTAWIGTTAPATVTRYGATSSDELLLDLVEDLYDVWKFRRGAKGADSISSPGGSRAYSRPSYPSKRTVEKHGLVLTDDAPAIRWYHQE